jgi:hypothetical protein
MIDGKVKRLCEWRECRKDISHRRWSAKTCNLACKEKLRHRMRYPNSKHFEESRSCKRCGNSYLAMTSTRKYCGPDCRYAAGLERDRDANTQRAKGYRHDFPERYRAYDIARRKDNPEKFRLKSREYYAQMKRERPDDYYAMLEGKMMRERQRNAEAALSAILPEFRKGLSQ